MGSGSPDFSQESSLLCGFEDDSRDISFHEFEVMVRQAYPNAQSPSTWTSPPGVLTPTSSLDPQRERSDFNDANSFSHQFMPVQTQDELLRSLAPTSPSMSLATSFEISEDELPQDEQLRATHGTVLQQQSYQQSYQTANETLVDGMFSGQNRNFNLSAEAYSNNVVNQVGLNLAYGDAFGPSTSLQGSPLFGAGGHNHFATPGSIPHVLGQDGYAQVIEPAMSSSVDGSGPSRTVMGHSFQRGDSPWSPLNVSFVPMSEGPQFRDPSWLGPNMQQMIRPVGNHIAPRPSRNSASRFIGPSSPPSAKTRTKRLGGRSGGLKPEARQGAAIMRKIGDCWICGIRREKCNEGTPCNRCEMISQRGQTHYFGCDRRHLTDMLASFLPESMSSLKEHAQIQAFVQRNMMTELDNTILVHLTIGCGRSLALPLYEFRPTSDEFLYTFAYMADGQGGWHRRRKRSPPLAIKHSTKADKALLTAFVTDMVTNYLEDFKEMTCDGEDAFLPDLLKLLCDLYIGLGSSPQNKTLRDDLHVVLMIIVLTHIICHAITIDEGAKEAVISQLSRDNDPRLYEDWTSPRMANSQLKQVFGEIRDELLIKVLNRLHQILRSAKDKNRTWLSSFIIMLGIAMVSEEYQHLLHIQADRYISRGESTEDDAMRHARQGCTQIDEGFKFLQQLFHYKYRPKHQKKARFTDWSHKTFDPADTTFVHCFEDAVTFRAEYLRSRKDLNIYSMTEGNHTSRLVSRFLADFMDLEPNSP
ncbi:hypothetical protein MBLNU459_g0340t2 [Dothideomycetes sp. NU459]